MAETMADLEKQSEKAEAEWQQRETELNTALEDLENSSPGSFSENLAALERATDKEWEAFNRVIELSEARSEKLRKTGRLNRIILFLCGTKHNEIANRSFEKSLKKYGYCSSLDAKEAAKVDERFINSYANEEEFQHAKNEIFDVFLDQLEKELPETHELVPLYRKFLQAIDIDALWDPPKKEWMMCIKKLNHLPKRLLYLCSGGFRYLIRREHLPIKVQKYLRQYGIGLGSEVPLTYLYNHLDAQNASTILEVVQKSDE